MALNQGLLDSLINAATRDDKVDTTKLALVLSKISDKLFGIGEAGAVEGYALTQDYGITAEGRGVKFQVISIDANGIIRIGADAGLRGIGQIAIPRMAAAQLPAGSVAMNGVIAIDSTNNRIVYYTNNLRYWIPIGTAF